jgi:RNA polymerase sigma-70 factor (ECF subfamily)
MPSRAAEAADGGALAMRFDAVYADHHAFVWRCLRGLGVVDEGLEDAAQEVFLVVHRQLERFEQRSSIGTWLFSIARKVAANHRRTARRKDQRVQALAVQPRGKDADPLEHVQADEAARFVQDFLARVGDKKRDVFLLAVLEQMSMPDVAEALSIPLNTAYTRMRAVRADFQRALTQVQNGATSERK